MIFSHFLFHTDVLQTVTLASNVTLVKAGQVVEVRVTTADQYGNPINDATAIPLDITAPDTSSSSVTINATLGEGVFAYKPTLAGDHVLEIPTFGSGLTLPNAVSIVTVASMYA